MATVTDGYAKNVIATYHRAMINQPQSMYPYKDSMQKLLDYWTVRYPSWWSKFREALGTGDLTFTDHNEVMEALAGKHAGFVPPSPSDLFQGLADKTNDWSISKLFSVTAQEAGKVVESTAEAGRSMFTSLGVAMKYLPYVALAAVAGAIFFKLKGKTSLRSML